MARTPKYHWIVIFNDGSRETVFSARGCKDAGLQAMWIRKERTNTWPPRIREIQKHVFNGSGFIYKSYRYIG